MPDCSNDPTCTGLGCKCCPHQGCCPRKLPYTLTCIVTAALTIPPFKQDKVTINLTWNEADCQWEGTANFQVNVGCSVKICFGCNLAPHNGCVDFSVLFDVVGAIGCCATTITCVGGQPCTCTPFLWDCGSAQVGGCSYGVTITE